MYYQQERVEVYLRLHPRRHPIVDALVDDPYSTVSASLFSFARTLDELSPDMRLNTTVNIFLNNINESEINDWMTWCQYLFQNRT